MDDEFDLPVDAGIMAITPFRKLQGSGDILLSGIAGTNFVLNNGEQNMDVGVMIDEETGRVSRMVAVGLGHKLPEGAVKAHTLTSETGCWLIGDPCYNDMFKIPVSQGEYLQLWGAGKDILKKRFSAENIPFEATDNGTVKIQSQNNYRKALIIAENITAQGDTIVHSVMHDNIFNRACKASDDQAGVFEIGCDVDDTGFATSTGWGDGCYLGVWSDEDAKFDVVFIDS